MTRSCSAALGFGLCVLLCGPSAAAHAGDAPRYYPALDGPKLIDDSVPKGEGARFVLRGKRSVGGVSDLIGRIRSRPGEYVIIEEGLAEQARIQILLANPAKKVVVINEEEDWVLRWYLEDSWASQAKERWIKDARETHLIAGPIDGFSVAGMPASYDDRKVPETYRLYKVSARMYGPDGKDFYVQIRYARPTDKYLRHEMMYLTGAVRLVRHGANYTLEEPGQYEGHIIRWWTPDGVFVSISTIGVYPAPVIEAYLKKYPSALPAEYQYDRNEWGREHVDIVLAMLRVNAGPQSRDHVGFLGDLRCLARDVSGVDFHERLRPAATLEDKRAMLAEVEEWARENRDKLIWSPARGKFVVGQGPAKPSPLVKGRATVAGGFVCPAWVFPVVVVCSSLFLVAAGVWLARRFRLREK